MQPHEKVAADEEVSKDEEIGLLRILLIATGRNIGAFLTDEVSTAFLRGIPEEARLQIAKRDASLASSAARVEELTAENQKLRGELSRLKEDLCPKDHTGHFFNGDGVCMNCGKYDKENDLKLVERELAKSKEVK